jgi:hypothetical protein
MIACKDLLTFFNVAQHVGLNNGVVQMNKLIIGVSAYVAFLLAPIAANPATIVVPYTVPLPIAAGLPPLDLPTTPVQQFDPARGTLNDVGVALTGPFAWLPNNPADVVGLFLRFGSDHITTPFFPAGAGTKMANVTGTLTSPSALLTFTGTSSITGDLSFNWSGGPIASPDAIARAGATALSGTITYDYTPAPVVPMPPATWATQNLCSFGSCEALVNTLISAPMSAPLDLTQSGGLDVTATVPEPSTWAMMLLGFLGLGFAFRQSRRKASFA